MSGLTSTTPSVSGGGGSTVQDVPQLPEVVVKVTDFEEDYGGDWGRVKEDVDGINRTDEGMLVAMARVHVVVSDRSAREIVVYHL